MSEFYESRIGPDGMEIFKRAIDNGSGYEWRNRYGNLHRIDGPALKSFTSTLYWYKNNKCHREDGPAVVRQDGTCFWFIDGEPLTFKEWVDRNWDGLSKDEKLHHIYNGFQWDESGEVKK